MDTQEFSVKLERLHNLMGRKKIDAVWITKNSNLAWLSGGNRTYIETTADQGIASILVTRNESYVLASNIEGTRLREEENFKDWEIVETPWYQPQNSFDQLTKGLRVATDQALRSMLNIESDLINLRAPLTSPEVERYRMLGRAAGAALAKAARAVQPGMREYEAASLVAKECYAIDAVPAVVLIASDERFYTVRHGLPTDKPIKKVVMLVVCARRHGLFANLTRIVHFGRMDEELRLRMAVVSQIAASTIARTRPDTNIATIFRHIDQAYSDAGFPGEWQNHHQGGSCSYGSRDYFATPNSTDVVCPPQAFAWNPSVPGAKSEDTVLITDEGFEVLTPSPNWPVLSFKIGEQTLDLASVLAL